MRSGVLCALTATLAACTPAASDDKGAPSPAPSAVTPVKPSPTPTTTPTPKPTPTPSATPSTVPEKGLQALGTEPFWSVEVSPKWVLKYVTPDMLNGVVVPSLEKRDGDTIRYLARFNGKPFTLTFTPAKCSDGMSDVVYPFNVEFVHSGRTDKGCGRPRK